MLSNDFANNEKVVNGAVYDDEHLTTLGYQPELKRSFSLLGMIGFFFSIVTCWSALGGVLVAGVEAGGPPVMIWVWVGISGVSLCVAYSLAEMCSKYPVAGGQYTWVYILSPPSIRRGSSYMTGWFMIIGILAMGATNSFIGANFILGMTNLRDPDYVIERWYTVLTAWAFTMLSCLVNRWGEKLLNKISKGMLVLNVVAFITTIATILSTNNNKQSASFVFEDFQNFTGFGNSMACIIGILQPAFGMCCYDAPAHMTEEIEDASKKAPLAIVCSVWIGAATGFVFLVSICLCIGDIDTVAVSTTGVPLIQIYFDSTTSILALCFLASFIVIINFGAANALMAEGSRSLFAFARDNGLPFSKTVNKVSPRLHVPVVAIVITAVVQMAFCAIYFGTVTGFNTVIAIATQGFYLLYAMPLLVRLISHLSTITAARYDSVAIQAAPWRMSRRASLFTNCVGLLYLCFACITFNFPNTYPVTADNINYTSAATGAIMFLAAATWIVSARKTFSGPEIGNRSLKGWRRLAKSLNRKMDLHRQRFEGLGHETRISCLTEHSSLSRPQMLCCRVWTPLRQWLLSAMVLQRLPRGR